MPSRIIIGTDHIYRRITPIDIDKFIHLPKPLFVDASDLVVVVDEDTMMDMDVAYRLTDYAIYCSAGMGELFALDTMDWTYKMPVENGFNTVLDAHGPLEDMPLEQEVIDATAAKLRLGTLADDTRFVHYKQCNRFFKYSFRIADGVMLPDGGAAQLYAVYLDSVTGEPRPYWITDASGSMTFLYADASDIVDLPDLTGPTLGPLAFEGQGPVTAVVPPDPDFLESKPGPMGHAGRSLAFRTLAGGDLDIRAVGVLDASGNADPALARRYVQSDFMKFSQVPGTELLLYWVIMPGAATGLYMGDRLAVAWCSKTLQGGRSAPWAPIRDIVDASGQKLPSPVSLDQVHMQHRFSVASFVPAESALTLDQVIAAMGTASSRRMFMPASSYNVAIEQSVTSPVVVQEIDVQFSYDVANDTDYAGHVHNTIMGGRIMQLVSHYMFGNMAAAGMSLFPQLAQESKTLTNAIIDALGKLLKRTDAQGAEARQGILQHLFMKHGRCAFHSSLTQVNQTTQEAYGLVSDVLRKLDEVFLFFVVTVRSVVSNRARGNVDVVRFVQVPVVINLHSLS